MAGWNPWHGCHKYSAGCLNCYVYRIDARNKRDSSVVAKTADFYLPIKRARNGDYKLPSGELVYTCFTSDFLLEDADAWRSEAWDMMRRRRDLRFLFVTKRIERLGDVLPDDWGDGYENVIISCTAENQEAVNRRLPVFLELPIRHRQIICEPLLERVEIERYLGAWIERVSAGGESGEGARPCDFEWVLSLHGQCVRRGVAFSFHQTGANFIKDGRHYSIPRAVQHRQAKLAGLEFRP